jgi:glycosyltransferase involved in cell wall biosynthesis
VQRNDNTDSNINPNIVVIFPSKNEQDTIEHSILTAKQSAYKPSNIIVIDSQSTDNTVELAKKTGAVVIQQPKQIFPGKGVAMKTGIREGIDRSADVIVFLDADIKNLTSAWIDKLVSGLLEYNYDMTRGFYLRHAQDAAVTKLIARPMLHVFFPELSHFEQPLSGEVCARKDVWQRLIDKDDSSPDGWGIDIWFLIEAVMLGYNIKEVFLGSKEHTSFEDYREDIAKLSKMAEQVEITIIREALRYNRLDLQSKVMT